MFLIIDNYDSFVYNLYHYLGELGAQAEVWRNDAITVAGVLDKQPQGIVISPGPSDPDHAGICLDLVEAAAGTVPILGVCLGHQTIGQAFGGRVTRSDAPMHGKVSGIHHQGTGLFQGIPSPLSATRYHSLILARDTFPEATLAITAESDDGIVMGLQHRELPVHGVQFHPESIASEHGHDLLRNFLRGTGHNA